MFGMIYGYIAFSAAGAALFGVLGSREARQARWDVRPGRAEGRRAA